MRSALLAITTLLTVACASSDATLSEGGGGSNTEVTRGVTQGGAQDIARFRSIVQSGGIPAPETLDATGFLAEHAFDLPPATCGASVCVNPMLAVAPRFDGGNWTMGFVALSTAVDPSARARRPLHLVVVLEESDVILAAPGLREGVARLMRSLRPEDRVSLVSAGSTARVRYQGASPSEASFPSDTLGWRRDVALYEALATARTVATGLQGFTGDTRVLLLTTGRANAGAAAGDAARIIALGEGMARAGVALSVVGMGESYDERVPMALGSIAAGTYAYAMNATDLGDILDNEARTSLFPLATDFVMTVTPARGYRVGRIYGARRAVVKDGNAVLESPALFIGSREGSRDVAGGRRGGGGGLFIELIADATMAPSVGANANAFTVEATWRNADTGVGERTGTAQRNGLAPGQNPADSMWPEFSDENRGKAFMALNMYLALRASVTFYDAGDCARAQGVIDMMDTAVELWRRRRPDPDIDADAQLMERLRTNLLGQCRAVEPIQPRNFSGGCFYS